MRPVSFCRERQKRRLQHILSIVGIAQYAPAQSQYHRAVPPHQHLERRLIVVAHEAREQLPVRQAPSVALPDEVAQIVQDLARPS